MYLNERSRRRPSEGEGGRCSSIARLIKLRYDAIMKSKFPAYLCISTYFVICLLGNVVTGIIFFKHRQHSTGMPETNNNVSDNMLFNIDLNESTFFDSSFEFDNEYLETEEFDLYRLFVNESSNVVS
jgi:hypothetical protein